MRLLTLATGLWQLHRQDWAVPVEDVSEPLAGVWRVVGAVKDALKLEWPYVKDVTVPLWVVRRLKQGSQVAVMRMARDFGVLSMIAGAGDGLFSATPSSSQKPFLGLVGGGAAVPVDGQQHSSRWWCGENTGCSPRRPLYRYKRSAARGCSSDPVGLSQCSAC
ncbi:hypothetical protein COO60DRAFT_1476059 [Scenedesmus sp. NREL 46B-D3]|nr:hypothetical protein COO60DRAFT_1476059 [Scenedesmus sp. NREL 46B-D3]